MVTADKPLVWLQGEIKTPPFSPAARLEVGYLLRCLQKGERLTMPQPRPMPTLGARCHELRIVDKNKIWRIIHRVDDDAIIILQVFQKQTQRTPVLVIAACRQRLRMYDAA
jgi:phage-related protein